MKQIYLHTGETVRSLFTPPPTVLDDDAYTKWITSAYKNSIAQCGSMHGMAQKIHSGIYHVNHKQYQLVLTGHFAKPLATFIEKETGIKPEVMK